MTGQQTNPASGFAPQNPPPARGSGGVGKTVLIVAVVLVVVIGLALAGLAFVGSRIADQNSQSTPAWSPTTEPTHVSTAEVTSASDGQPVARTFGGPVLEVGSTGALVNKDGSGTITVDQVEWVANDGQSDITQNSFLKAHVNLTCETGKCEYFYNETYFVAANNALYSAAEYSLIEAEPVLEQVTLTAGNTWSGWAVIEAPEQQGVLIFNSRYHLGSDPGTGASVRYAIDGPSGPDIRQLTNQLDTSAAHPGHQVQLLGYEVTEGDEYYRPAEGMQMLVLHIRVSSDGTVNNQTYASSTIIATQDGTESDTGQSSNDYDPYLNGAILEPGDTFEGYFTYWIDPTKPVVLSYGTPGTSTSMDLGTIQP